MIAALAFCWGGSFVYLSVFGGEGSLPPASRVPEVPAGATVVGEDTACGSGGCWRVLKVRPAAGQTAEDLARQMGVDGEREKSPSLTDPATVHISSDIRDGLLIIQVGYQ
ncbi:hypothetical protein L3i22_056600 [Actinoplanes sp. L3-i22]|nr:hypothetical protein L3i22_056600 [Actinoplanes sp. L3-i22]